MKSPDKVKSLMLFGSTAGLRNSQAASWLPRIAKEGLRGFFAATIADRLPLDKVPKGLVDWFVDETGKNDPGLDRPLRRLMSQQEWSDEAAARSNARPCSSCRAARPSARSGTTTS